MTGADVGKREVIDLVLPRLQSEGYDVYVHPSPSILPPFMASYRPDAIALKEGKKIAIEVIGTGEQTTQLVRRLRSLFAEQAEWELQLIYAPPLGAMPELSVASREDIVAAIREAEELLSDGRRMPAILMAYATFEAIGRALLPDQFKRPQSPGRLVEVLASEGLVTPDEAQIVRQAISVRNAVAHGGLGPVDDAMVTRFIALLSTLADLIPNSDHKV